jgi:hypothetical protein
VRLASMSIIVLDRRSTVTSTTPGGASAAVVSTSEKAFGLHGSWPINRRMQQRRSSVVGKVRDTTQVAFAGGPGPGRRHRPQGPAVPAQRKRRQRRSVAASSAPPGDAPARPRRGRLPRRLASPRDLALGEPQRRASSRHPSHGRRAPCPPTSGRSPVAITSSATPSRRTRTWRCCNGSPARAAASTSFPAASSSG